MSEHILLRNFHYGLVSRDNITVDIASLIISIKLSKLDIKSCHTKNSSSRVMLQFWILKTNMSKSESGWKKLSRQTIVRFVARTTMIYIVELLHVKLWGFLKYQAWRSSCLQRRLASTLFLTVLYFLLLGNMDNSTLNLSFLLKKKNMESP